MAEATLVCLRPKDGAIEMQLRARRTISTCPACGTASRRVHSHYQRKLADLPWEGLPVVILLQARKFFCVGDSCRRKIFTEPLPGTVARYARRSCHRAKFSTGWGGPERDWHAGSDFGKMFCSFLMCGSNGPGHLGETFPIDSPLKIYDMFREPACQSDLCTSTSNVLPQSLDEFF